MYIHKNIFKKKGVIDIDPISCSASDTMCVNIWLLFTIQMVNIVRDLLKIMYLWLCPNLALTEVFPYALFDMYKYCFVRKTLELCYPGWR